MGGGHGALIAATILLFSCFVRVIQCDPASAVSQEQETQRLRSKVAALGTSMSFRFVSHTINDDEDEVSWTKEETSQLEDVVREKTAQIAALVGGLDALQVRNAADDASVVKSSTSSALLEKQIERLGNDLEDQVRKGELLESRAREAERRLLELDQKLERVEKINIEQRKKIEELEHDLQQHSQEKLPELETRAKLTAEELAMARGMWLPYWFASRSVHCQELASAKWHLHGKPVLDALTHKKLLPVAKAHFNSLKNSAAYRACRDAMQPCMVKTRELADHYWQAFKKFSEPYIARIAAASEPHLSRARVVLGPYTMPVMSAWTRIAMSTSMYHRQVHTGIGHFLESNELLNPHSAHGLAWWMASALFVLPMFAVYRRIFSATVR
ncbi:hypothetical protein ACQ4PT_056918 [Festuca glaucescens]